MTADPTAVALAEFKPVRQPAELRSERIQQEAVRRARDEVPGLHRLLDEAAATVRASLAVIIENFPLDTVSLVTAAGALGRVDPTNNGPAPDTLVHHVIDSAARPYRDADPFHTDSPLQERPHAYLGLLCVRPSPTGDGRSVLVSAADIAAAITSHEHLRALQDPCYPFAVPPATRSDKPSTVTYPILTRSGEDFTVRYCPVRVAAGVQLARHALDTEHADALQAFERALEAQHLPTAFLLRAGELLLLDNRRLLHGRTDVGPAGVTRHLMRVKVHAPGW
ncbi:TauD/TfdA family dioxygenase [Streptomyces paromomycinus]|uniref:TauD/TfdA-like domain-containing protein n=1 Tax=Streptomyces paromomycinus TaxID=92743 RepID=A0A401VV00_STREY|nr:TauD/TfdA family dioxygenase [Streptomyces paromomycinus]GCD40894.1 hypothetical protein GKJPGBOP_00547 [Streptomyces paromomycinus]